MEPFRYHIGQLFVLGVSAPLHRTAPDATEVEDETVVDYLADWAIHLYLKGVINTRDVREYVTLITETHPEISRGLYSWLQAGDS